jgi:hypothetical protein
MWDARLTAREGVAEESGEKGLKDWYPTFTWAVQMGEAVQHRYDSGVCTTRVHCAQHEPTTFPLHKHSTAVFLTIGPLTATFVIIIRNPAFKLSLLYYSTWQPDCKESKSCSLIDSLGLFFAGFVSAGVRGL